jgi:hypothetical protein
LPLKKALEAAQQMAAAAERLEALKPAGTLRNKGSLEELGVAWERALLYVKGGYAAIGTQDIFSTNSVPFTRSAANSLNSGYAIGAGIEYKFTPNWSAKVEYMYYDFGHQSSYYLIPPTFLFNQTLRIDTVKVGLNYIFGGPSSRSIEFSQNRNVKSPGIVRGFSATCRRRRVTLRARQVVSRQPRHLRLAGEI